MPADTAFVAIMAIIGISGFGVLLKFLRRVLEMRHERLMRASQPQQSDLSARLDRIENAVETTALEVERIAESNRFLAKLLAENGTAMPVPKKPERVITPH